MKFKKILRILLFVFLGLSGLAIISGYFETHIYYTDVLLDLSSRGSFLVGSFLAGGSVFYALSFLKKKLSFPKILGLLVFVIALYSFFTIVIHGYGDVVSGRGLVHVSILMILFFISFLSFFLLGSYIYTYIFKTRPENISTRLFSVGIGLSTFLFGVYVLLLTGLLYPLVSLLIAVGAIISLYVKRVYLSTVRDDLIASMSGSDSFHGYSRYIMYILATLSVVYLMYIFYHGYIPYPTARDANHAYLFYPKMRAYNTGVFWDNTQMAVTPHIWYSYITYWFSLFRYTDGLGYMSSDTIAIVMNAMSGFYVLIFGLGLIGEVLHLSARYIHTLSSKITYRTSFLMGRGLLLARLTSGMGAFLTIVDNKTDLGVLSLVILALYSGFFFLNQAHDNTSDGFQDAGGSEIKSPKSVYLDRNKLQFSTKKILIISGCFFAFAGLAKPTALFDAINFYSLLWWLILGIGGASAIGLLILCVMSLLSFRGINDYISPASGYILGLGGGVGVVFDFLRSTRKKCLTLLYTSLWRGIPFILTLVVVKGLYIIPTYIYQEIPFEPNSFVEKLFFSDTSTTRNQFARVQNSNIDVCSLPSLGYNDISQLYTDLKNVPAGSAYDEDVGRYIGYGWKGNPGDQKRKIRPYTDPWWGFIFGEGCVGLPGYAEAGRICRDEYGGAIETVPYDIQENTINTVINTQGAKEIYLPYKYMVWANATFNRSLQNSGSYYTDIGYIWLILMCLMPISFIISLVRRNYIGAGLSLVTLMGWLLRGLVAGGIVRYGIGIIVWTILNSIVFFHTLAPVSLDADDDSRSINGYWVAVSLMAIYIGIQLLINYMRISGMSNSRLLSSYRMHTYQSQTIGNTGVAEKSRNSGFTSADAIDLQFAHYTKFLDAMNTRASGQGAWIAGTYARYFVENQDDIVYDQFLTWLWRMSSDNNLCASYLRLKDKNMKYLALDPNIGTVVQGAGNSSLFDRFFGVIDEGGEISQYGGITLFTDLVSSGYAILHNTNNIAIKYALSGDPLLSVSSDSIHKYKLLAARYFVGKDSTLAQTLLQIAEKRIQNNMFLEDYADMFGKEIRLDLLQGYVSTSINLEILQTMTEDEKLIFSQFMRLKQTLENDPETAKTLIIQLI